MSTLERVREACRRRLHLEGADAQALESALTMTEKERDALLAAVDGDAAAARAMTYAKELDAATAEVARLQAALRQAEGERLELAWFGLLPDELPDDVDWRRAHEVAELAKRIVDGVAAANGGRDGG